MPGRVARRGEYGYLPACLICIRPSFIGNDLKPFLFNVVRTCKYRAKFSSDFKMFTPIIISGIYDQDLVLILSATTGT